MRHGRVPAPAEQFLGVLEEFPTIMGAVFAIVEYVSRRTEVRPLRWHSVDADLRVGLQFIQEVRMAMSKATPPAPARREPFGLLRQMTSELDRVFDEPFFASFHWPPRAFGAKEPAWSPDIDVFEKDNYLVTRIDLPGMKKEEVKVEVTDGHLAISGERSTQKEEKKDNEYRSERAYGSFYRAVPLPKGAKLEEVKATFADGVLEVTVPLAGATQPAARQIEINAPPSAGKTAA